MLIISGVIMTSFLSLLLTTTKIESSPDLGSRFFFYVIDWRLLEMTQRPGDAELHAIVEKKQQHKVEIIIIAWRLVVEVHARDSVDYAGDEKTTTRQKLSSHFVQPWSFGSFSDTFARRPFVALASVTSSSSCCVGNAIIKTFRT